MNELNFSRLTRQRVRIAIMMSDPRVAPRLAMGVALMATTAYPLALAGSPMGSMLFLAGAPAMLMLIVIGTVQRGWNARFLTQAWLTQFVEILGVGAARPILRRAAFYARTGQPLKRQNLLDAVHITWSEQRQAAREAGGVRAERIGDFLQKWDQQHGKR